MSFSAMMDDAFKRLAVQEACPKHEWAPPRREISRRGKGAETWETFCELCGRRAGRPSLDRLKAEVIGA